jgi:uncharacterized protein DUF5672
VTDKTNGHEILGIVTRMFAPVYRANRLPSRTVAIAVPLSSRPELTAEEEVSMRHLSHFLGGYDKYLVAPESASSQRDNFKMMRFPEKFFGSAAAHNRLLMWPGFYNAFRDYEYILIYHLDSLVLSDQILQWCKAGFDYIGAPWVPCAETPWVKEAQVGNGGFTLMKVETVLKVLYNRYRQEPASYWSDLLMRNRAHVRPIFWILEKLQHLFPDSRLINRPLEDFRKTERPDVHGVNNDYFWSFDAKKYVPEFKVASVEEGMRFAFEAAPRECFERIGRKLPFGCHAWAKFDRTFWEPHLLPSNGAAK